MELFNNIARQQNTQVHTEQKAAEARPLSIENVKTQIETGQERVNSEHPITSEVELKDLIDTLNKALDPFNTSIRFGFDNSNEVFFVSVIDANTNDTIRRFPAEKAQSLLGKMNEIVGIIFDEKG